jgi:fibronectin type 3 domain-containing protein
VAGYNVYRTPSGSSSYQLLNSSVVTQAAYVDSSVQSGQTYNYIVKSVDASGNTSIPSNMASAVIP